MKRLSKELRPATHRSRSRTASLAWLLLAPVTYTNGVEEEKLVPASEARPVNITQVLPSVEVRHQGKTVILERHQDPGHTIDFDYALTSRPCPPYCIQPMTLAPGIETIGELEVIAYVRRLSTGDESILLIDSRTPQWLERGMIPGAINIPWTKLHFGFEDQEELMEILELRFGASRNRDLWNFQNAKTLVLYCNGAWCGQSPTNIRSLLSIGYPAHKLKWYRGGMQSWKTLGLKTVTPDGQVKDD